MRRTIARRRRSRGRRSKIAELAGFSIPEGKTFLIVKEENIGKAVSVFEREAFAGTFDLQVPRL